LVIERSGGTGVTGDEPGAEDGEDGIAGVRIWPCDSRCGTNPGSTSSAGE